jgi:hypothetical protein|nr:MAG TPA_asm: Lysis protein [Caudoviricetes sp.]
MKKWKLAIGIAIVVIAVKCIGCSSETLQVNVANSEELANYTFGASNLRKIGDYLWYDSSTRIVYFWNGELSNTYSTAPTPYYAPNGRPYRYDPATNTFEEIDD